MKHPDRGTVTKLEELPNVGKATAQDLRLLGIESAQELKTKEALVLYEQLNALSGVRHDPCVLDVFMAVIDFMNGAEAKPWWEYTERRKQIL